MHLAIVYEYATWHKKTDGSLFLRSIMTKFGKSDPSLNRLSWGAIYYGEDAPALTAEEMRMRERIVNVTLPVARARMIKDSMDTSKPWYTRIVFMEALAALCALHKEEVQRKVTGQNKPLRKLLWNAASADRMEWYFNSIRMIHGIHPSKLTLLPCGTASNEALHAEIKAWFRPIQRLHQSTLKLKLRVLTIAKLLAHNRAMYTPTTRQLPSAMVLARALPNELWTEQSWRHWCVRRRITGRVAKAGLRLRQATQREAALVRRASLKRPAGASHAAAPRSRKRHPFQLERQHPWSPRKS